MKRLKEIGTGVLAISLAIVLAIVLGSIIGGWLDNYTKERTTKFSYNLEEINDGVYAIYYVTHSKAPAYNYDVVTLNCNGSIKTFKGSVSITYSANEPYVNVVDSNYVNNDKIYVYIPKGSIKYARDVGIE